MDATRHTGIALDDIAEIDDYSEQTLLAMAERLERSATFQEFIAREIELDELFRRVETGLKVAATERTSRDVRARLEQVYRLTWEAHDLAGEGQPLEAAARLRTAITVE